MGRRISFSSVLPIILSLILVHTIPTAALPLSTKSRWIVEESTGVRVKLACVNWVAHLETMVAEGLSKQPMDVIAKKIVSMGFNCVRFTWPLYLAVNQTLASLTVRQSCEGLGLSDSVAGLQANNRHILDFSLIQAYQEVVTCLGSNNVMVILDNHISKPSWCCSYNDRNGFFGDADFSPELWIKGLTFMATAFKGVPNVVGMSLRNELRGPKQNVKDWYRYMQQGAEAVHSANPDVLVILSGLSYAKDLSFLHNQPVALSFNKKLVFEAHWYAFTDGEAWKNGNPNQVCGKILNNVKWLYGFLLDQGWPLFVSEFGIDIRGTNVNDNRYINCFLSVAAELDLDWALWTLVGSYDLRQGIVGMEEFYGVLSWDWREVRSSSFLQKVSAVQAPFRGPGFSDSNPHVVIFHPLTGQCVLRTTIFEPLKLGPCTKSEAWKYTPSKTLTLKGTYFCIQAEEIGKHARLGTICSNNNSKWDRISDSNMHFSSKTTGDKVVCLDVDSSGTVITSTCKCLSKDSQCDPANQWFKLVNRTRSPTTTNAFLQMKSVVDFVIKDVL